MGRGAIFPARCVSTNRADDLVTIACTRYFVPNLILWFLFSLVLGPIGYYVGRLILGNKVCFRVQVNRTWRRFTFWAQVIGYTMLISGALLLGFGVYILEEGSGHPDFNTVGLWCCEAGLALQIGCLIPLWLFGAPKFLRVAGMEGEDHFWLKGVSPQFLAELPVWKSRKTPP